MIKTNITLVIGLALTLLLFIVTSIIGMGVHQNLVQEMNAQTALTPQAIKTATARVATATASAVNVYPSYMPGTGKLSINDSLQQANYWDADADQEFGGFCQFKDGALHARQEKPNRFFDCRSISSTFRNFAFEVQMTIIQGDCGGFTFRSNANKFYFFRICQSGTYRLSKYADNKGENVFRFASGAHKAIKTGLNQMNLLGIYANDNMLRIFVNGQQVALAQDADYTQGGIALIANDVTNPTEVVFRHAKVWEIA